MNKPKYPGLDDIVADNTISRYTIVEPCPYAEGAFKQGFLVKPDHNIGASQIDTTRTYVMKIFKPFVGITADAAIQNLGYMEHSVKKIFEQEIQKLDRIEHHPNIARIVDAGTYQVGNASEGLFYFVEEYVEGKTLSQIIAATKVESETTQELKGLGIINEDGLVDYEFAISIAHQIAKGLKHLHMVAKMAHSDVKPSNILISSDYRTAVLTDFGSATVLRETDYFQTGSVLYRAPEIFSDMSRTTEGIPRPKTKLPADKWALGVVMYEMLTGAYPFETNPADWSDLTAAQVVKMKNTLEKNIRRKRLRSPSEYNSESTDKMDELVMNLLQRKHYQRINMEKLVQKLGGFVSNFERKS